MKSRTLDDFVICSSGSTRIPKFNRISNVIITINKIKLLVIVEAEGYLNELWEYIGDYYTCYLDYLTFISGKGYPDLNTLLFLQCYGHLFKKAICITDMDPDGINIFTKYKCFLPNLQYIKLDLENKALDKLNGHDMALLTFKVGIYE